MASKQSKDAANLIVFMLTFIFEVVYLLFAFVRDSLKD